MFKYGIDHLTVGKALDILHGKTKAIVDSEARENIDRCHQAVLAIAAGEEAVYGINTGFGPLCNTRIDKEMTSKLQRNLIIKS